MSRLTLALITLALTNSCGLLFEPSLPSIDEINLAKATQYDEWELLTECFFVLQEDFEEGQATVTSTISNYPQYPRLSLLLQDFEIKHLPLSTLFQDYRKLDDEQPSALSALLLARVDPDRERRIASAKRAADTAGSSLFAIAKVFELGTRAEDGEASVVNKLVHLLGSHPGCAEGWRLLAELAPLHDRSDYVLAAAQTEPWIFDKEGSLYGDSKTIADKAAVVKFLQVGELGQARSRLRNIDDDVFVKLAEASVYARDNNPLKALELITAVIEAEPDNHVAIFNRALLYRDYFGYDAIGKGLPEDIRQAEVDDLVRFLELMKKTDQINLLRLTQAEYRLSVAKEPLN